jgi:hypothetical protein
MHFFSLVDVCMYMHDMYKLHLAFTLCTHVHDMHRLDLSHTMTYTSFLLHYIAADHLY